MKKLLSLISISVLLFSLIAYSFNLRSHADTVTRIDLIQLPIIATDHADRLIDDLKLEELKVFEGNEELTKFDLVRDDKPIKYVLVLDTSGSFKKILPDAVKSATYLVNQNRAGDETALVRFIGSSQIELAEEFTSDKTKLIKSLGQLNIALGQSSVIDAVYLAVQKARSVNPQERRAVVLISDGEDRNSFYNFKDLVKLFSQTGVQVFVVGTVGELNDGDARFTQPSSRDRARKLLTEIATESYGRVFFFRNITEMQQAVEEIVKSLHLQFFLRFDRTNRKPGNHKVDIKLIRPDARLVTKTKYTIAKPLSEKAKGTK